MKRTGLKSCGALAVVVLLNTASVGGQTLINSSALIGKLIPITGEVRRSVDLTIPFALGSAKLAKSAQIQLMELGKALSGKRLRDFEFGIYGHTDASGKAAFNLELSKRRAAAVGEYLVKHFGINRARIDHRGFGEERLLEVVAPTSPRNRRVEIVVFFPEPKREQIQKQPKPVPPDRDRGGYKPIN